jgi:hypothetical protein
VKKKLVALLVLGYVGGSFSEEPLSPFGPNPFAPHEEVAPIAHTAAPVAEEKNPFASSPSEDHPTSLAKPEESNPFEPHPFGPSADHKEETATFDHSAREHDEYSDQQSPALSETVTEKNPDTGEDAVVDSEVDTFEQEGSGNWLLKRVWWEKTEGVYESIKQVFNEIMSARMDYISQRNRLDRELDVSYGQIGLEEGELQDIIDYCLDFVKKEKPEQGFLSKQQEDLYSALQHKQHDLEQIKLDLKALQAVDQKIDEALDTLFKQIDVANQYEQKAWDNFKEIARELNDKIARKSYYETEGLLKDVQSVHSYITSQFSSYFNQIVQTARTHSQSISSQVQTLKQAGVDLKKEAGALEQAQEAERLKKELAEQDKEFTSTEKKKELKKPGPPVGMVSSFISSVKLFVVECVDRLLQATASVASHIKKWFVKEESVIKAREKTLKIKMEDEKKKVETALEKEEVQVEHLAHTEEQRLEQQEADLHKRVHAEQQRVEPVLSTHPVSVMPQEHAQQAAPAAVTKFGFPPTEAPMNHPAFSHSPSDSEQSREIVRSVSPFAK